ncbi:MAG: hypothetical protein OEV49_15075 [candidate division Zixibacteria bacterium]|nr:hypothetical protein [candidate division Zixibacteria bacterium]MDH3938783.1 hypothetical protein [candidate division Zixibacteria bacterium]MDH4032938.1 hypothetical protein [candidate division Zixibacteria bacterium]
MNGRLDNSSGFTIMEVLVAAVVFMAGFSIMVALLSSTLAKFSSRELVLANNIAREQMMSTVLVRDTTGLDTTVTRSGIAFELKRRVTLDDGLAKIRIGVYRQRTGKQLVDLYNELAIP